MKKSGKKILFVTSSFEEISLMTTKKDNKKGVKLGAESHYALGIAYLHSYLESQGITVESLCFNHLDYETCKNQVIEKINSFSPDFVGIQMLTPNRVSSYMLIEYIHKNHPKIKIILGGIHATVMYDQLLKKYPYVIIVLGEGELTLTEIVKSKTADSKKIKGIVFFKKGKIIMTPPRELIEDLDSLPFPKHELFFNTPRDSACILSSRGCPFKCSFCSLNPLTKRRVRFRSPKNVVDEIEYLVKRFPQIKEIWFHDDSLFVDNERVIEICKEILRRGIKKDFIASGRIKPLSERMIRFLERANFKRVLLGVESGDNDILRMANKGINQEDIINAFKMFAKSKINIKPFIIIGLPGENEKTIKNTINLIKKLQRIKYHPYTDGAILTVYPGTQVYELAKQKGMMTDDFWMSDKPTPAYTAENSLEKLYELKEEFLDNLSLFRMLTLRGFILQFPLLPYTLKYVFWTKRKALVNYSARKIKSIFRINKKN